MTGAKAMRSKPLKLTGQGDPHRFRANNGANGGIVNLQLDKFREVVSINLNDVPDDASLSTIRRLGILRDRSAVPVLVKALAICVSSGEESLFNSWDGAHLETTVRAGQMAFREAGVGNPREEIIHFDRDESWDKEVEEFLAAVREGRPAAHGTLEEARQVMRIVRDVYALGCRRPVGRED